MSIVVNRSIPRIVTIGGDKFRVYTEDFRSPAECEQAMESVLEFCRATSNPAPNWDSLADLIMIGLDVPRNSVHGCSIIAEPAMEGGEIIHLDGNPNNNDISNLRWIGRPEDR